MIKQLVNSYKLLRVLDGIQIMTLIDDMPEFEVHRQKAFGVLKQIPDSLTDPSITETAINKYMMAHPKSSWQHVHEDQNFIFMFAQKTESVTSVVTYDENVEVSEVDSQRDAMSIATQENEYQNLVNSKQNDMEKNPEYEVSETYINAHQILNAGYDEANLNFDEEEIPQTSNFRQSHLNIRKRSLQTPISSLKRTSTSNRLVSKTNRRNFPNLTLGL